MGAPKQIKGEPLRAYIQWGGQWRHVYIHGSYDQNTLVGEPVRMINFKLTKNSKDILQAEKMKFHKKKPYVSSGKKGVAA